MAKLVSIKHAVWLCVLFVLLGCEQGPKSALQEGGQLPEFKVETLEGTPVMIQAAQEGVTIVKVWATWCEICRVTAPQFDQFMQALPRKDVAVIALAVDRDVNLIHEYLLDNPSKYQQRFDENMQVTQRVLGSNLVPQTIILDSQNRVQFVAVGAVNWDEAMAELITKIP